MYRECRSILGTTLLTFAAATSASAQEATRQFSVTPSAGIMYWDPSSGLAIKKAASNGQYTETRYNPTVGIAADYKILSPLSLGVYLHAARPTTRGDFFPAVLFDYGTRTEVYAVSQRVTTIMYGLQASGDVEFGRFAPFVSLGTGITRLTLDPEQTNGNNTFTNGHFQFGGGLGVRLGDRGLLRADIRDFVFRNWDRDRLNPVRPGFQNTRLPAVNSFAPAEESTIHNWRFALGFTFVPRRSGEGNAP